MNKVCLVALLATASALVQKNSPSSEYLVDLEDTPEDYMLIQDGPIDGSGLDENKPICTGNNEWNCIEAKDLPRSKNMDRRAQQSVVLAQEPVVSGSGDHKEICTGLNDGRCVESDEFLKH